MLFNSFEFLFFFIAIVLGYYLLSHKYRWIWLLLASYYFYYAWEPKLVLLLMASTSVDYLCGIKIHNSTNNNIRKLFLIISICVNLAFLIFFKYLGFFTETSLAIINFFGVEIANTEQTQATYNLTNILLPIGISFYTFQTLSYSIEIYRKNQEPERHLGRYALYVSFFPQLIAGPIERAKNLLPQIKNKVTLNVDSIKTGLILMAWGFFMKMVVADRLGIYVDKVFEHPEQFPGIPLIVGGYFFLFQIYFDFAAYSIIAIGAARVLGVNLMANFNRPIYFRDAQHFWSKWHISFMTWLRDYLYRPLVKNARINRSLALFIVFFISGLWHGAGWNFIIWGVINGLFVLFEVKTKNFRRKFLQKFSKFIRPSISQFIWWFITFHVFVLSLIFFRSPTFSSAANYFSYIPKLHGSGITTVLKDPFELILSFLLIIIVQAVHYFKPDHKVYEIISTKKPVVRWSTYLLFILVIVFFSASYKTPFIYFQF